MVKTQQKIQIIPLGGLGEIGKNMTVVRYGDDIIVIDAGLMFPEDDMLGIDLVIPDISYLLENRDLVRGIILTHGHEDHIGALPYVLKQLSVPVYGTRLTLGILEGRLKENNVPLTNLISVKAGDQIEVGPFKIGFIRISHSIADAVALSIKTPVGTIVHTGDFKFDQTPVDGKVTDFHKLAELGDQGVLVMLADSTNAEHPGYTMSEKSVGVTFDEMFYNANGRIIIASFSSNVHRVQQAIDTACKYNRKVAVLGRSMINVVTISSELGYLNIPEGILIDIDQINNYPASGVVIITTGSQGEPMSALTRMAMSDHRKVDIVPGDTIIISATPIPGNEKLVSRTIDYLLRQGAEVLYERTSGIHVSGHASQEELKMMHNLIRPKFFIPVHGEYRHLVKHSKLAQELGMAKDHIFIAENGQVLEFTPEKGSVTGKVSSGIVLIDGLGVGDVGNIVLRDRRQLSQEGILIVVITMDKQGGCVVAGPDIVSRGFVYVRESEQLMDEAKNKVRQTLDKCELNNVTEWAMIKSSVRDTLGKYLYEKTRRRPMILPIIMEV
ncbi:MULTISPECIES: ribonuclease J [Pelosinus]|uniref:Ribonuclease J n=1 Tax=Pelosinus fermentans B4 TaxID=1149862 RepID=I9B075_9FIRM|nr:MULTISPECIES: ribonuclease J [Pelosinus]EIW18552.1 Ribocuclease J [Pelosinus fermentans B4]EIW24566.1 Ribocuclease J [Pelosinus fermentans A11]OAM94376.1 Ribocuclease J [Pelosinus fermentans DSM 17108]SDR07518.1 ribonuclease J [Pelosinus fermentans]